MATDGFVELKDCLSMTCAWTDDLEAKYKQILANMADLREIIIDARLLGKDTIHRMKSAISDAVDFKEGEMFDVDDADTKKEVWAMLQEHAVKF
jgi:hypothetical protein